MKKVDNHWIPEFRSVEELLATINLNLIEIIEAPNPTKAEGKK